MTDPSSLIELTKTDPVLDVARCMTVARTDHGKSLFAQIGEIVSLGLGPGKLKPRDYYYYGLYDDSRFSDEDKRAFVGARVQRKIHLKSSDRDWWAIAHDKLLCYALLAGLKAPTPRSVALYHSRRSFAAVPVLRDGEALAGHLREGMPYPFFGKPITGMWSAGSVLVERYDRSADSLVFSNGAAASVDDFVAMAQTFEQDGYLFQEPLVPHPAVAEVCGNRLSTVRLVVALGREQAEIFHAVWKIPTGDHAADNFWRSGNMLGQVDVDSGTVIRAVQGVGVDHREAATHPDTGGAIAGTTLPNWDAAKSLCLSHAEALSGIKLQAWDIALCPAGPVVMEINIGGDLNLPQLAAGAGILDGRFREFLAALDR